VDKEYCYLRTISVIAAIDQSLDPSLPRSTFTFWHWAALTSYTSPYGFAGSCVVVRQSHRPIPCDYIALQCSSPSPKVTEPIGRVPLYSFSISLSAFRTYPPVSVLRTVVVFLIFRSTFTRFFLVSDGFSCSSLLGHPTCFLPSVLFVPSHLASPFSFPLGTVSPNPSYPLDWNLWVFGRIVFPSFRRLECLLVFLLQVTPLTILFVTHINILTSDRFSPLGLCPGKLKVSPTFLLSLYRTFYYLWISLFRVPSKSPLRCPS